MASVAARLLVAAACVLAASNALASGWLDAGDIQLRSDLTTLVDAGTLDLPIAGWPIPRSDVCDALPAQAPAAGEQWGAVIEALARLRSYCGMESRSRLYASAGDVGVLRGFTTEPRSDGVVGISGETGGERWSARLDLSLHGDAQDDQSVRPDGSYLAGQTGNWVWSAGWLDRWWGPGWDGSLIWSNNARPIPGIAVDRVHSTPFDTKWLSWIGPWRATVFLGALEKERVDVDNALFLGIRVAARPLNGLELAFSRTAQFCGDGLPCSWSSLWDLLFGYDNAGRDVAPEDEPGNQMGSVEARWSSPIGDAPYALYTQLTGEDEANFFPVKLLKLYGADGIVTVGDVPVRVYLEYADTSCASSNPDKVYNCAYNQTLFYEEGYRYRGRVIGHAMDSDGLLWTLGAAWTTPGGWSVEAVSRYAEINRGGEPDDRHTISPTPLKHYELVAGAARTLRWGTLRLRLSGAYQEPQAPAGRVIDIAGFIGFEKSFGSSRNSR
jgi:hypothetical protein